MRAPPFFLVWNENGNSPMHKHHDQPTAEREAERLARLNPGTHFFVLAPICRMIRADIERERFDMLDTDVPF